MIDKSEKISRLRLIRTENVGPVTFQDLIARFGSARAALDALPEMARRGGAKKFDLYSQSAAEDEFAALEKIGGKFLFWGDENYPTLLAHLKDAPPVLNVVGHDHLLSQKLIGMVGARNASINGQRFAYKLAEDLGKAGVITVSGLARGVDTNVHQASLSTGTVAVVAGGLDVIYPPENEKLYEQIKEQGAIVSELPLGTKPMAQHFPRRNRIISGLALGVVVVEATLKSGSLITARYAAEQGRDVFAVPGSPMDPRSQGCNALIRDGAMLVTGYEDIISGLRESQQRGFAQADAPGFSAPILPVNEDALDEGREILLEMLSPDPVPVDELIRRCDLPVGVILSVILELELAGKLVRHQGNQVSMLYEMNEKGFVA